MRLATLGLASLLALWAAPAAAQAVAEGLDGAWVPRHGAPGPSDEVPENLSAADWSSIRQAYEAHRHSAHPVESGYQARNPGQRWRTHFDGRGFTIEPDACAWTWGLQLKRYGFAGQERPATHPARMSAEGGRVAYAWDDTLTEWYVNDTRGLEHGYTVRRRLLHDEAGEEVSPLTFTLTVRGELTPEVADDGRGVRFVDGDGAAVLTYSGLLVVDADGHLLPARLEHVAEGLLLTVDERGARYPLTIDPVAQQAYLKASNTDWGDEFGRSVSVSGDTVVVGAWAEASSATGVNGDQADNSAIGSGAAYVFVRSGHGWTQQAYLKASNTGATDNFGSSASVSGDTVVVGAPEEDSQATGVDGDGLDDGALASGAAYVFVRNGTTWTQQAYLKASNTDTGDRFGHSVGVSGDTVVVGARFEDSDATGVDGDEENDDAFASGAAYVFTRSGTSWSQQAYLKASNTGELDVFGYSVAVSDDTVVVGAYGEDSLATGVDGDQEDDSAAASGAAYVFVRSGAAWSQQAYLKASNSQAEDFFGWSVSVSGDTVVVGAYREDSNATGVDGDQDDNDGFRSGAAYVFVRSGTVWSQQAYLKASNTDPEDEFGWCVAVSGDTVLVGARAEDSMATGVDGDQGDTGAVVNAGAAYVFSRAGSTWSQRAYLKPSNTDPIDLFGHSVGASGDTLVVGSSLEDSGATGVDGDQMDNSAPWSGAVYVFDLSATGWFDMGCALAGASGDPLLAGTGDLTGDSLATLDLTNAAPSAPAALFLARSSSPTPFKGGTLKPVPPVMPPLFSLTTGAGSISLPGRWPVGVAPGTEVWVQWAIVDATAVQGVALSNALLATTP